MNKKSSALAMMIPFAVAMTVTTAPAASAQSAFTQSVGKCTGTAHAKMKAKHDNGRIELELEIDSNRNGQRWAVRINDNKVRITTTSRVTHAPSGSFTLRKLTTNRAGVDHFVAVATHPGTHQTCLVKVNL